MCSPVLILGLGNPLRGDDGIGPRAIEALKQRELPPGTEALDAGAGGLDLLGLLEGWRWAIIIDAADVGRRPGEFVRFTPEEARLEKMSDGLSLHNAGLTEALALARVVGQPLPEIVVFGVQPEKIGWGEGLSHAVEGVLPALVEAVCDEVARLSRS